jgi:hypothetical protein
VIHELSPRSPYLLAMSALPSFRVLDDLFKVDSALVSHEAPTWTAPTTIWAKPHE